MDDLLTEPYFLCSTVTIISYLLIFTLKKLLCCGKPGSKWDSIVGATAQHTTQIFMIATALYLGFRYYHHTPKWHRYANQGYFVVAMLQVTIWANYLVEKYISLSVSRKMKKNPAAASSISLVQLLGKFVLISTVFLFTLNNLGIQITTILAGLGVGGLAVALAIQKILGDLFSSLSIVLDKPFMVGDFIIVDNYLGEVEKIGLRTTHLRSLGGEQIIMSNSDILNTRIRNYKRMHERRVSLNTSLPHTTSRASMAEAIAAITQIVQNQQRVRFERCHFMEIGPTSMNIQTVYWVLDGDHHVHMDIQQTILFEICSAFERLGLSFAMPAQALHIQSAGNLAPGFQSKEGSFLTTPNS